MHWILHPRSTEVYGPVAKARARARARSTEVYGPVAKAIGLGLGLGPDQLKYMDQWLRL